MRRAFTLVELLIVLGIMSVLLIAGFLNISGFRNRSALDAYAEEIAGRLRSAQFSAVNQELGSKWGVYFDAPAGGGHWYALFSGDSYAAGTVHGQVALPANLKFTDPAAGSSKEIIFSKLIGDTSSSSVRLSLMADENIFYTISVAANGLVTYAKSE